MTDTSSPLLKFFVRKKVVIRCLPEYDVPVQLNFNDIYCTKLRNQKEGKAKKHVLFFVSSQTQSKNGKVFMIVRSADFADTLEFFCLCWC